MNDSTGWTVLSLMVNILHFEIFGWATIWEIDIDIETERSLCCPTYYLRIHLYPTLKQRCQQKTFKMNQFPILQSLIENINLQLNYIDWQLFEHCFFLFKIISISRWKSILLNLLKVYTKHTYSELILVQNEYLMNARVCARSSRLITNNNKTPMYHSINRMNSIVI